MARSKTEQQPEDVPKGTAPVTFGYFSQEVGDEEKGIRVFQAHTMEEAKGNNSGSYSLDYELTTPFPEGRIIEIYGEEGTCKTTLALEVVGQGIKNEGKIGLYVNMEKNLNPSLMRTIRTLRGYIDDAIANVGKKNNECPLWIVNAANGEQGLEAMRRFCELVPNGIAVLDSIDAAQPEAVLSGEIGENKMGNLGKLMSDAMRKLIDVAEANKVTLIFINQVRDKITAYGDPTSTPGGKAMKFYASQRIRLLKPRKDDFILVKGSGEEQDGERIGVMIRYTIIKNKFAPDGNDGVFPILFKNGIFREQELVTQCANFGILKLGSKGGKQVYLPKVDRDSGSFLKKSDGEVDGNWMSQFNASRKLLIDPILTDILHKELMKVLQTNGRQDAVDTFTNEVQDAE